MSDDDADNSSHDDVLAHLLSHSLFSFSRATATPFLSLVEDLDGDRIISINVDRLAKSE